MELALRILTLTAFIFLIIHPATVLLGIGQIGYLISCLLTGFFWNKIWFYLNPFKPKGIKKK